MRASSTIVIERLATAPTPPSAASASWPNVLHTRITDVVAAMGPAPWAKRLIADERQLVTLIALSMLCFAASYLRFMRQEIRAP